jgi:hypothetical protein
MLIPKLNALEKLKTRREIYEVFVTKGRKFTFRTVRLVSLTFHDLQKLWSSEIAFG